MLLGKACGLMKIEDCSVGICRHIWKGPPAGEAPDSKIDKRIERGLEGTLSERAFMWAHPVFCAK